MFVSLITGQCSGTSGDLDSHPTAPTATTLGHCAPASRLLRNALRPGEPVAAKCIAPQHRGWALARACDRFRRG